MLLTEFEPQNGHIRRDIRKNMNMDQLELLSTIHFLSSDALTFGHGY